MYQIDFCNVKRGNSKGCVNSRGLFLVICLISIMDPKLMNTGVLIEEVYRKWHDCCFLDVYNQWVGVGRKVKMSPWRHKKGGGFYFGLSSSEEENNSSLEREIGPRRQLQWCILIPVCNVCVQVRGISQVMV